MTEGKYVERLRLLDEARKMWVLGAATLERDLLLHGMREEEQDVMIAAILHVAEGLTVEALREIVEAQKATNEEAERAKRPGENAWSSAPMVRLIHAHEKAEALLGLIKSP